MIPWTAKICSLDAQVTILKVDYDGDLKTTVTHEPSGSHFTTDAPKDHAGKGRSFAPTDLLASSIGACSLTYLAIRAKELNYSDLDGSYCTVDKIIADDPPRRIGRLNITIHLPDNLPLRETRELQWMVYDNPVLMSVRDSIEIHYYWE